MFLICENKQSKNFDFKTQNISKNVRDQKCAFENDFLNFSKKLNSDKKLATKPKQDSSYQGEALNFPTAF